MNGRLSLTRLVSLRLGRPDFRLFGGRGVWFTCGAGVVRAAPRLLGEFLMQAALRGLRASCGLRMLPHVTLRMAT